jgi:4-aminobutyrate aminotransferase / (S)-3-amino-2-methylpropionate transaminase / 5-aminovalerate transaminase
MILPSKKYKSLKKLSSFEISSMTPKILTCWKKAKDYYVWDAFNKKLIDFTSTIFVSNIGHSNKRVTKRVIKTLNSPISHSYNYFNIQRYQYSRELIKFINNRKLNKCYLLSSGTEATEAALKLMRLNGIRSSYSKTKNGIISLKGNWHGRTMGSQMMSGNNKQSKWIGFHDKNMYQLDFPYSWKTNEKDAEVFFKKSLIKKFGKKFNYKKNITGFIIEAFQGWGAFFYPLNYIKALKKFCKKNDILITIDEMQSGFGRTGFKFLYEYYKLNPDLLCCGKAMGSGFPLSGVVSSSKIMNIPKIGDMSSTHSANPIVCSAGLATLEEIKSKKLVLKSKKLGIFFRDELLKLKKIFPELIYQINCKGLIAAIIFKNYRGTSGTKLANRLTVKCYNKGLLLVNTGRESIKLGPPLIITKRSLIRAIQILNTSIKELKSYE